MRTRIAASLGLAGLVLVVAGCVSLKRTPEGRFFVLDARVQPPPAAARQEPVGLVGIESVRLPDYLDRPQLVTWAASSELTVDEFLRWAEPLEDGIARTVATNVAALLPEYQVVRRPWPGRARTRCRVQLEIREFGLGRDGIVQLNGRFALLPDHHELAFVVHTVSLSEGPLPAPQKDAPPDPGVDEMSSLLEKLSRQVADAIRALPPEEDVGDPEEGVADLEEETVESEEVENR